MGSSAEGFFGEHQGFEITTSLGTMPLKWQWFFHMAWGKKKTIQEQHRQTKRQSLKGRFWIPLGEYPNVPREYCPTEQAIYSRYMLAYIVIILRVLFEGDPHFSVQISKD